MPKCRARTANVVARMMAHAGDVLGVELSVTRRFVLDSDLVGWASAHVVLASVG
jgi:hypothetical protein